ncbi:MAG: succinate dehydrogenase cytochrome b subunit [Myxococcota bacterium]|nr:succinate dehydrogenase cytochrome b subunit [Myxococcota bacterium]
MNRLIRLFGTSIGRKLVMAVTGVLLIGFLISHMLGNMTVFQGQESMNYYAAWLKKHPFLWVARAGLLTIFGLHVVTAISLAIENNAARPEGYRKKSAVAATLSSRYIVVSGLLVLAFLIYHLAHFTFGWVQPDLYHFVDEKARHDVYRMVVLGFQNPIVTGSYVAAMLLLGFHLHHGARSLVQTIGLNHESYNTLIRIGSNTLVAALVIGNCSIPLMILAGFVDPAAK